MNKQSISSWGRIFKLHQPVVSLEHSASLLDSILKPHLKYLPYGNGRSYGDSCLNANGGALKTRNLDRFIDFDPSNGILRCESGVLLSDILNLVINQGWFLPVTPGTRFVTVGGAIANDVHGKNHHIQGTFGNHVLQFELLRSDGSRLICSKTENKEFFNATIAGLGLTGMITWAEIQLRRIRSAWVEGESIRFTSIAEFFDLCTESDKDYEYTVAWVDCSGKGNHLGRGLFLRGNHAPGIAVSKKYATKGFKIPFVPPISLINPATLKLLNTAYYHKQLPKKVHLLQHYEPFFYPLDGIYEWNRIYGPKGFYQYQCVIPTVNGLNAINALLIEIESSGLGSFLAVLKLCGNISSNGLLSFPMPGISLAMDFPNRGPSLHQLFSKMDKIVYDAGGRLYPAKDGRMPGYLFRSGFTNWSEFANYIDPHFSSSFWRRVTEDV